MKKFPVGEIESVKMPLGWFQNSKVPYQRGGIDLQECFCFQHLDKACRALGFVMMKEGIVC